MALRAKCAFDTELTLKACLLEASSHHTSNATCLKVEVLIRPPRSELFQVDAELFRPVVQRASPGKETICSLRPAEQLAGPRVRHWLATPSPQTASTDDDTHFAAQLGAWQDFPGR